MGVTEIAQVRVALATCMPCVILECNLYEIRIYCLFKNPANGTVFNYKFVALQYFFSELFSSIISLLYRLLLRDTKRKSATAQLEHLNTPDGSLGNLLEDLPQALLRQFEYEDSSVRAGLHLMHSDFFKVLVALACDLELDKTGEIADNHKWYVNHKVLRSLVKLNIIYIS